jgi:predicted DNA-binding mobile mystery protein A
MKAANRATARRQLEKRLAPIRKVDFTRPSGGWIRAIRESLGMTTTQLAKRIGVGQSRVIDIQKAEISNSITLDSLRRSAQAMGCELVYALIPRKPLDTMVEDQAALHAKQLIKITGHTMRLEDQGLDSLSEQEQLDRLTKEIAKSSSSKIWNEG